MTPPAQSRTDRQVLVEHVMGTVVSIDVRNQTPTEDAHPTPTRLLRSHCGAPAPNGRHGYEAMTITADDRVLSTPGVPSTRADR